MSAGGVLLGLILVVLVVVLIFIISPTIKNEVLGYVSGLTGAGTTIPGGTSSITTTVQQSNMQQAQLVNYTLALINRDRANYSLPPVTLSYEPSAQQHADSMFNYYYISHWDIYGMKPYMRYALLGGLGAVSENIAFEQSSVCFASICSGNINPQAALQQMEHNFVYNDSACCQNGHRDNILNPYHNQVSIGIAYNGGRIYLVQDFIDNYTQWNSNAPSYSNGEVFLSGNTTQYTLSSITVSDDALVRNMTQAQLNATFSYGYGAEVAGVVNNPLDYYQGLQTIVADRYVQNGNGFDVSFNMNKLIRQYGAGEYTVMLWLNGTGTNSSFVGSTYTIFINQSGQQYVPRNV